MTKEHICVGADDRKLVRNNKSFDGVDKIYPLDDNKLPMIMMVNGPAAFAGSSFKKLCNNFKNNGLPSPITVENIQESFISYLESLDEGYDDVDDFINFYLPDFKSNLEYELFTISKEEFDIFINNLETHPTLNFLKNKNLSFRDIIPSFVENVDEINEILIEHFSHHIFLNSSEIIITGFEDDGLASLIAFRLYLKTEKGIIYETVNVLHGSNEPIILTFADDIEIKRFLNGIDSDFEKDIRLFFSNVIKYHIIDLSNFLISSNKFDGNNLTKLKLLIDEFLINDEKYFDVLNQNLHDYKFERFNPIFQLTESLPDDELIDFTIFLVNLTYYKRRYSMDKENVGRNVHVTLMGQDSIKFFNSKNLYR